EEQVLREASLKAAESRRVAEKEAKTLERYLSLLRHTFSDSSGKYSVDAVLVALEEDKVALVRMNDKNKLELPLSKLSAADIDWIEKNKTWVKLHGAHLADHLL